MKKGGKEEKYVKKGKKQRNDSPFIKTSVNNFSNLLPYFSDQTH